MDYTCPTCERRFDWVLDYPLIKVVKVSRVPLNPAANFKIEDNMTYFGPESEFDNPSPPEEVLGYFAANQDQKYFLHEGWNWEFREAGFPGTPAPSLRKRAKEVAGRVIGLPKIQMWEVGSYTRSQSGQYAFNTINKAVAPFLKKLEGLVGKEVRSSEVAPMFEERGHESNYIPGTQYELVIKNLDDETDRRALEKEGLTLPDLETSGFTRKSVFVMQQSEGVSVCMIKKVAVVGGLAYEGRLKS